MPGFMFRKKLDLENSFIFPPRVKADAPLD